MRARAMMLAGEKITDGSALNAGRDERITINQTTELIFELMDWRPKKINHDLTKPQGVSSRAADLTKARKVLGWEPKVTYRKGFEKTIQWYFANNDIRIVKDNLKKSLMKR